jgi:hypothetical protein
MTWTLIDRRASFSWCLHLICIVSFNLFTIHIGSVETTFPLLSIYIYIYIVISLYAFTWMEYDNASQLDQYENIRSMNFRTLTDIIEYQWKMSLYIII